MAAFESGVAHYRAGQFESALQAFLEARRRGLAIPNVDVNLGLSYYRLGRYPESAECFGRLAGVAGYEDIARFHLGLIAARRGDAEQAARLWRSVEREASQAAMRDRADLALGRLGPGFATPRPGAYLLVALAGDSNPALLNEGISLGDSGSSGNAEIYGALDYPMARDARQVTWLRGGAHVREYFDADAPDQHGLFAGLARESVGPGGRRGAFLTGSTSRLDGERFSDAWAAGVYRRPAAGAAGLAVGADLARVVAPEPYRYLEGWRLQLDLGLASGSSPLSWRTAYQFEANDRRDLEDGAFFSSQSPLRHRLELTVGRAVSAHWLAQVQVRYRHSRYRDPDRFEEDGTPVQRRRVERLARAGLQLRRHTGGGNHLLIEYQYSDNRASRDVLAYERHLASIGYEWTWRGQ